MKSLFNIQNSSAVILIALLAACSGKPENKTAQLEALKKEQVELAKKIDALQNEIEKENPDAIPKVKMKDVSVVELAPRPFDHYVQTQGSIVAIDNIQMSAKSAGIVTHVYTSEGDAITQGQILAQIDNTLIVRHIHEMKQTLDLANTVYDRQKNLWDQKIGTEVQYLQAKNNKESLERRLATLQEQNEMTKIKAPINATVDQARTKVAKNLPPAVPASLLLTP